MEICSPACQAFLKMSSKRFMISTGNAGAYLNHPYDNFTLISPQVPAA